MSHKKGLNKRFLCRVLLLVIQQPEMKLSLEFVMCWNYLSKYRALVDLAMHSVFYWSVCC